jgi:hypothetical protein
MGKRPDQLDLTTSSLPLANGVPIMRQQFEITLTYGRMHRTIIVVACNHAEALQIAGLCMDEYGRIVRVRAINPDGSTCTKGR